MRRTMLLIFKLGLTVVLLSAVWMFYYSKMDDTTALVKNVQLDTDNAPETTDSGEDGDMMSNVAGKGDAMKSPISEPEVSKKPRDLIHLVVVACGRDRVEETLVVLKSALFLTKVHIWFHLFTEEALMNLFHSILDTWPADLRAGFTYELKPLHFPSTEVTDEWKKLFKPCASQRLFLPDVLPHVDAVVYVDTDVMFFRPLEDLWAFFAQFNSTQLAALTPEHEWTGQGWYNRFARHPYYGVTGVNSGVMLMNLTRLRAFGWLGHVIPAYQRYKMNMTWGDQDLINIVFSMHPERLYVYPCQWNWRPDHCMYGSNCKPAEREGVSVLHGNRGVFHNDKEYLFKTAYRVLRDSRSFDGLPARIDSEIRQNASLLKTYCGRTVEFLTKQLHKQAALYSERIQAKRKHREGANSL